ncbi:MAG: Gfo/Idh/MocA family oxidoreductase [Crenarchaeota archaeon]|nr:Gfo/Idh/MocA family oxidoreductase [Thermoproteota archaeon]
MIRIGILGYGFMGSTHAKILKTIEEAEIAAIADPKPEARKKAANDFPSAKIYEKGDELIRDKDVEAVIIATPPDTHVEYLIMSINEGKHVLVEKPLAPSFHYLEKLLDIEIPRDLVVMSGFSLRYHKMYEDLHEHIKKLGKTYIFHHTALGGLPTNDWLLNPEISGGMLNENAVHIIYLFLWYLGEPENVYARLYSKTGRDMDDNLVLVTSIKGSTASLLRSWTAGQIVRYYEILGEKGSIHVEGYLGGKINVVIDGSKKTYEYPTIVDEMYREELLDFISSIKEKKKPRTSLRDAILIQLIVEAAKKSSRENKPVPVMEAGGELAEALLEKYRDK